MEKEELTDLEGLLLEGVRSLAAKSNLRTISAISGRAVFLLDKVNGINKPSQEDS